MRHTAATAGIAPAAMVVMLAGCAEAAAAGEAAMLRGARLVVTGRLAAAGAVGSDSDCAAALLGGRVRHWGLHAGAGATQDRWLATQPLLWQDGRRRRAWRRRRSAAMYLASRLRRAPRRSTVSVRMRLRSFT
jgi:hypothetical protein